VISAEQIGRFINNPASLEAGKLEEFKEVLDKYPYCSSLHLIYLISLSENNHIQFEDQLKVGAAHVMDREQLYSLINNPSSSQAESTRTEKTEEVGLNKHVEEEEISEAQELDSEQKKEKEIKSEDKKSTLDSADNDIEITESSLDEDILSHAIEVALEQTITEEIPKKEEHEEISSENEEASSDEIEFTLEEVEKIEKTPENLSFIEWLKYKQTIIETGQKTKTENKKVSLKDLDSSMSKKEINRLLDKFISEEPSISKPDKELYNPTTNAKKSVEESLDITSETLAKIHEMQGNYTKAIASYKQLILLYPEKRVFFASQIEKIKLKIN